MQPPQLGFGYGTGGQFRPGSTVGPNVGGPPQLGAVPGMPPLMPLTSLSWAAVPGQPLLVAHTVGCVICAEFLRHYGASANDAAFVEAQTTVQGELQARFWRHFEEHARSEGGRAREEAERAAQELATAQARIEELEESRDREQARNRRQANEDRELRERYRSERNSAKERISELEDERRQLLRQLESIRPPSALTSVTHGSGSSGYIQRDPRKMSPRRDRQEHGHGRIRTPPRRGHDSRQDDYPSSSRLTDAPEKFTAYDSDESDEDDVYDVDQIQKVSDRQRVRNARRDLPPPPAPGTGPAFTMAGQHAPTIRIPEGWPSNMLAVPAESDARLASHWYNFVPVSTEDARMMMSAAHADMGEARHRIQHLLAQISDNPALTGVQGMRVLNEHWRNPDRRTAPLGTAPVRSYGRRGSPQYTPPGLIPTSTAHLPPPTTRFRSEPAKPRINQPRLADAVSRWIEWLSLHQSRIPAWMERADGTMDGAPRPENVELHLMIRRPVGRGVSVDDRGRWISLSQELFSVPGLYRHIIQHGHYPRQPVYSPDARFAGSYREGELTVFHVARWYASAGVGYDLADRVQMSVWRARALFHGRDYTDLQHAFPGINSVAEVPTVPNLFELQTAQAAAPPTAAIMVTPAPITPTVGQPAGAVTEMMDTEMAEGPATGGPSQGLAPTGHNAGMPTTSPDGSQSSASTPLANAGDSAPN
ncbi:hypothetical protein C2E23DRAFT_744512 [Lenzites betulinus]|nr:hypothetical protein C2E23DRAFT_744512 [Lenzites betulinus]